MLNAINLACSRGRHRLFAGLSFRLEPGQWLQVSGGNGAGKTSLLTIVAGLRDSDAGRVEWQGQPIAEQRERFHRDLLFVGHASGAKEEFSALENLRYSLALDGVVVEDAALRAALERLGLRGRERLPARVLSAGQRRRLVLARLLLRPARLWVLDEALTALDAEGVDVLGELLAEHLATGGMALLTSHQAVPLQGCREIRL